MQGGPGGHSLPLCLPRVSRDHGGSASRDRRWVCGMLCCPVPCRAMPCHAIPCIHAIPCRAGQLCRLSHTLIFPRESPGAPEHRGHP